MRWTKHKQPELQVGQIKYVTKFLFWPKTINEETRWLEIATIKYVVINKPIIYRSETRYELRWKEAQWEDHGE